MESDDGLTVPGTTQHVALTFAELDEALDALFGAVPAPNVMALSANGLIAPMPAAVPVTAEQRITGACSALELCLPGDLQPIVEAWERMHKKRGAKVAIHLRTDPEHAVTLHFVDACLRYGVYLGFIVKRNGAPGGIA